jgi:hypothetical protein
MIKLQIVLGAPQGDTHLPKWEAPSTHSSVAAARSLHSSFPRLSAATAKSANCSKHHDIMLMEKNGWGDDKTANVLGAPPRRRFYYLADLACLPCLPCLPQLFTFPYLGMLSLDKDNESNISNWPRIQGLPKPWTLWKKSTNQNKLPWKTHLACLPCLPCLPQLFTFPYLGMLSLDKDHVTP